MQKQRLVALVSDRFGLERFAVTRRTCDSEHRQVLAPLPKEGGDCAVVGPIGGMWEHALVCGYFATGSEFKALVIYTERPRENDEFEYDVVPISMVKPPRQIRPPRDILNRRK